MRKMSGLQILVLGMILIALVYAPFAACARLIF